MYCYRTDETDGDIGKKRQRHREWRVEKIQSNGDWEGWLLGVIKLPLLALIQREDYLGRLEFAT